MNCSENAEVFVRTRLDRSSRRRSNCSRKPCCGRPRHATLISAGIYGYPRDAALAVVVCGDGTQSDVWIEDCSIASILVQLTAQSLGLGSCWVQIRQRQHAEKITSEQYIQERLGIPSQVNVESIIAIGYPVEQREPLPREQLKTAKVHTNRF